jgi:hypothetical protein
MDAFDELHLEFDRELLRLDWYPGLALVGSQLHASPGSLSTLVASTAIRVWRDGREGIAHQMEPIAARIAADVTTALGELRRFARTPFVESGSSVTPASPTGRQVLDYLIDALSEHLGRQTPILDIAEASVLRCYLESQQLNRRGRLGTQVLRYLLSQRVSPQNFADAVALASGEEMDSELSQALKWIRKSSALAFCWHVLIETDTLLDV